MTTILAAELARTAAAVHPDPTLRDVLARVKYVARGLLAPRLTRAWFDLLRAGHLEDLVARHPHIFSKLQRPYLHRRLSPRERLAVLRSHYCFVADKLGPETARKIYAPGGLVLSNLPGQDAGEFRLRLFYDSLFEKEGEMSIGLFTAGGNSPLFTLTFCVSGFGGARPATVFIGGLQGNTPPEQKELVVRLTRAMHGLRPKALLVFALQRLAQLLDFSTITAVGDTEHIYRHYRKRRQFTACYNVFWQESQGEPLPDGNFRLPTFPQVRQMEDLPRAKRPLYRRRYLMLEQLGEEIRCLLAGLPVTPVTAGTDTAAASLPNDSKVGLAPVEEAVS